MKTKIHEDWTRQSWLPRSFERMRAAMRQKSSLILLIAMAGWATCGTSYADSIIGSPGAGFQRWTASFNNLNASFDVVLNPNTTAGPYWDYPTVYLSS